MGMNAVGLCWCCSSLAVGSVCKPCTNLCSNATALSASLRSLNDLVRSPSMPCVIKRLQFVILNSEAQSDTRRQEGCSLPYLYSAKIPSPYQNCTLLCSFSRSCGQEVITKATSPEVRDLCPRNVCASICFPEACLCVKVYEI